MSSKNRSKQSRTNEEINEDILIDGELNFPSDKIKAQSKKPSFAKKFTPSVISAFAALTLIIVFVSYFSFKIIPENILSGTDSALAAKSESEKAASNSKKEASLQNQINTENQTLKFTDQKVKITIKDYGNLFITLKDQAAPKTVENFVRLVSRKYYDNLKFHRITQGPGFNVIQGGDPKGDGTGGETANTKPLIDEIWEVKPEYAIASEDTTRTSKLINTPKFTDPGLYPNYSLDNGNVTFPKGLILMANTGAPDSNTSQFFITTDQTILPPKYTVFGVMADESSIATLDKIKGEVKPIPKQTESASPAASPILDGSPDKEILLEKAELNP
jgi:cyclophilin family peptidyl-prolyl cis-trans isomerase